MLTKEELQSTVKELGYDLNPYTSKDTLVNILRLHSQALEKGIDVPKLNDHELRRSLKEHDVQVGPIINYTRAIYQRKLLETITNETSEGVNDELDHSDDDQFETPPIPDSGIITRSGKTLFNTTQ